MFAFAGTLFLALACLTFSCKTKKKPIPVMLNSSVLCSLTWRDPGLDEASGVDVALFDGMAELGDRFMGQCGEVGASGLDDSVFLESAFSRLSRDYRAEFDLPTTSSTESLGATRVRHVPDRLAHTSNILGYLSPALNRVETANGGTAMMLISTYFFNLKGMYVKFLRNNFISCLYFSRQLSSRPAVPSVWNCGEGAK